MNERSTRRTIHRHALRILGVNLGPQLFPGIHVGDLRVLDHLEAARDPAAHDRVGPIEGDVALDALFHLSGFVIYSSLIFFFLVLLVRLLLEALALLHFLGRLVAFHDVEQRAAFKMVGTARPGQLGLGRGQEVGRDLEGLVLIGLVLGAEVEGPGGLVARPLLEFLMGFEIFLLSILWNFWSFK